MLARLAAMLMSLCLAAATAADAPAANARALDRFLSGLKGYSTRFTQQVRDAEGKQVESGSGRLLIARPGRFRWEYRLDGDGGDQLLLADGRNLWFYDRELAQATVKPQANALGSTPMLLLTGNPADWREGFGIESAPRKGGLDWQVVVPRQASADFSRAELGFRGAELVTMRVLNSLGQTVELAFSGGKRNPRIDETQLRFVPAPGVDVVGQATP